MGLLFSLVRVSKQKGGPVKKETNDKSQSLVKKLKKEVISEAIEETTQVESSVQNLKEPIDGDQKKID